MPEPDPLAPEEVLASQNIYSGRIVNLRLDDVELPNGHRSRREVVEHGEVVAIVGLDDDGSVLLVRQYRHAVGQALLELPAGGVDAGESLEEAAQREFQEETGFKAERLERLGGFYVSPGYCTEFIHAFLASGLRESRLEHDSDELIVVERMPLARAAALAKSGEIKDAKSIVGLLLAEARQM
ncbi:MAG TPA: NUDIX hydrolase [Dehalococcoidia bacterium]|nr:NUDIX hydrolase [Dehalococcoidia bacterium]